METWGRKGASGSGGGSGGGAGGGGSKVKEESVAGRQGAWARCHGRDEEQCPSRTQDRGHSPRLGHMIMWAGGGRRAPGGERGELQVNVTEQPGGDQVGGSSSSTTAWEGPAGAGPVSSEAGRC